MSKDFSEELTSILTEGKEKLDEVINNLKPEDYHRFAYDAYMRRDNNEDEPLDSTLIDKIRRAMEYVGYKNMSWEERTFLNDHAHYSFTLDNPSVYHLTVHPNSNYSRRGIYVKDIPMNNRFATELLKRLKTAVGEKALRMVQEEIVAEKLKELDLT